MATVLVVDDELSMREFLQILLQGEGHEVQVAETVAVAVDLIQTQTFDLVFTDLKLPDGSGLDVLACVRERRPDAQVILLTAYATTQTAVEAMRMGAYDYQIKPAKVDEVRALTEKALEKGFLLQENRQLIAQLKNRFGLSRMVGGSSRMLELFDLVERVAPTNTNVLIEGESGSGKELVARAIHEGSQRADGRFVAVNCGAIPESLIEAELFGHVAGAFTGARKARIGIIEAADGGTLLLDEIGELPLSMQVKLLRFLQERRVRRVGDEKEHSVDLRIIASTNRDLQEMVVEGQFREDLFYRLNVVRVRVPPLRERKEDIAVLARSFMLKYGEESGKQVDGISDEAIRALESFPFPGNVRELENYLERAVALAVGPELELADLPDELTGYNPPAVVTSFDFSEDGMDLEEALQELERGFIDEALRRTKGVKTRAADLLGLTFRSLRYRMQKLGIGESDEEGSAEVVD